MRIAICEDHKDLCQDIVVILQNHDKEKRYRMKTFHSGDAMWFDYQGQQQPYDLIILDIELPGSLSGLDVARKIREQGDNVSIVILTAYTKYALEGYSVQPFHYLVKPVCASRLTEIIKKVEDRMNLYRNQCLNLPETGAYLRIPFHEIIYMESRDHHVYIYTKDSYHRRYKKLSDLFALCDERFLCPHKSYIINAGWIKQISNRYTTVELENGSHFPISKHKKAEFIQALAQYDQMFSCLRA